MSIPVLIVEDDQHFKKLVEIRLKSGLPEVLITHAESITRAKELLSAEGASYTLVILDQHLPDGLGSELFDHPKLKEAAVLAVSADDSPEIPGRALMAGAQHFLGKRQVAEPLFIPLILALLERKKLERELIDTRIKQSRLDTIKVLLGTLRHEINNPLGAVLGAAYILRSTGQLAKEQTDALRLIEASGNRIKHVLNQLCETAELEQMLKGQEQVFHIPGDPSWEKKR